VKSVQDGTLKKVGRGKKGETDCGEVGKQRIVGHHYSVMAREKKKLTLSAETSLRLPSKPHYSGTETNQRMRTKGDN